MECTERVPAREAPPDPAGEIEEIEERIQKLMAQLRVNIMGSEVVLSPEQAKRIDRNL